MFFGRIESHDYFAIAAWGWGILLLLIFPLIYKLGSRHTERWDNKDVISKYFDEKSRPKDFPHLLLLMLFGGVIFIVMAILVKIIFKFENHSEHILGIMWSSGLMVQLPYAYLFGVISSE